MPTLRAILTRWLPAILWMSLIFVGSSDLLSAPHTSRFVVPFLKWLLGSNFTLEKAAAVHFLIRKAGHVTEYAVLAVLLWRALDSLKRFSVHPGGHRFPLLTKFAASVGLAATYAASDEFHQSFIPTRTGNPVDVLIDTVGAVLGLLIILALKRLRQQRRSSSP